MQEEIQKININCRFCNTVTGFFERTDPYAVQMNHIQLAHAKISELNAEKDSVDASELTDEEKAIAKSDCDIKLSKVHKLLDDLHAGLEGLVPWSENPESNVSNYGVEDSRCAACEVVHGSYADMKYEAMARGLTNEELTAIMEQTSYSKEGFDTALTAVIAQKNADRQQAPIENPLGMQIAAAGKITTCPVV